MKVKIVEKEILNPLAENEAIQLEINPIPENMNKISLFDNTKPNANEILNIIAENLNDINFIRVKKPAGAPATPKQLENATQADLSILALGDCGSCTTWVILDAIRLEKMKIPTICICSNKFIAFAHELARSNGMENLRIVEINHPIAAQSREQVEIKVKKILPEIKALLKLVLKKNLF
ncbi:MAG: UGSC family (seleno)protein [Methanobacterium sp.]